MRFLALTEHNCAFNLHIWLTSHCKFALADTADSVTYFDYSYDGNKQLSDAWTPVPGGRPWERQAKSPCLYCNPTENAEDWFVKPGYVYDPSKGVLDACKQIGKLDAEWESMALLAGTQLPPPPRNRSRLRPPPPPAPSSRPRPPWPPLPLPSRCCPRSNHTASLATALAPLPSSPSPAPTITLTTPRPCSCEHLPRPRPLPPPSAEPRFPFFILCCSPSPMHSPALSYVTAPLCCPLPLTR